MGLVTRDTRRRLLHFFRGKNSENTLLNSILLSVHPVASSFKSSHPLEGVD
jgi:hypothetical protein